MSAPRSRRNGLLLPLALTATAAAASFALYYFLHDDAASTTRERQPSHVHESDVERSQSRRRTPPPPTTIPHKKSIALVVREASVSKLLQNLPSPLPLDRANIFVLVYSPSIKAHPLSDSEGAAFEGRQDEGRVYRQARKMYPIGAPSELVMPYTDEASLLPMLKQLAPEGVYIEGSLVGEDAAVIKNVMNGAWVGGVVVAVEDPQTGQMIADATGRLMKVRVRDVQRVADDWAERVG